MPIPTSPEWLICDFTDDNISTSPNDLLQGSPLAYARKGAPYLYMLHDDPSGLGNDYLFLSNDGQSTNLTGLFNIPDNFTFECKFKLVQWPENNQNYVTNRLLFGVYDKQGTAMGIMFAQNGIAYIAPGQAPKHLVPPSGFTMTPGNYYFLRGVMESNGTLNIYITDSLDEFVSGQKLRYTLTAEPTVGFVADGVLIDVLGTARRPTEIYISTLKLHNSDIQPNRVPTAIGTPDIVIPINLNTALDGSASYDPEGTALTYEWSVLSSPVEPVELLGNIKATAVFFAGQPYELTFESVLPGHFGNTLQISIEVSALPFAISVDDTGGPDITITLPIGTNTDEILDVLTRVGHPSYNPNAVALITAQETGGGGNLPIIGPVTQVLTGGVDSTLALTTFTPTAVGEYVIELKVSDGVIQSEAWTTVVSVIEGNIVLGDVPDASYIWDYLLDSYQRIENKEIFETVWSGLLQEASNVLLRAWQTQYNLSLSTIQDTIILKWGAFRIREELSDYTLDVPTGWNPNYDTCEYHEASGPPTRTGVQLTSAPTTGTRCGIAEGEWLVVTGTGELHQITAAEYPNQDITLSAAPPTYSVVASGTHMYALDDGDGDGYTDLVELIGEALPAYNVPTATAELYVNSTGPYYMTQEGKTNKSLVLTTKTLPLSYQNAVWEIRVPVASVTWVVPPSLTFTEDMEHPPISGDSITFVFGGATGAPLAFEFPVIAASDRVICFEHKTKLTGTVTVAAGSRIIQGTGTLFTTEFSVGDWLEIEGEELVVASVADNYNMLLTAAHTAGAANADLYWLLIDDNFETSHIYLKRLARAYCHKDIIHIPRIQYTPSVITSTTDPVGGVLYNGIDFRLAEGEGYIDFLTTPYVMDESDYVWSEVIYLTNKTAIENHFGALIGVYADDIESLDPTISYLNVIKSLYYGLYRGPTVKNMEAATGALLGMPITEVAGIIEEINETATSELGRVLVRDIDNPSMVRTYFFRTGLEMDINESTGFPYSVGDTVDQFTLLTAGVAVSDWVNDPDWCVPYVEAGVMKEAEKLFLILLRVDADAMSTGGLHLIVDYVRKIKPAYGDFFLVVAKTIEDEIDLTAALWEETGPLLRIRDDLHTSPDPDLDGVTTPEFSALSPTVFGNLDPVTLEPVFDNGYIFSWFGLPFRDTYFNPSTTFGFDNPQWEQDPSGIPLSGDYIWISPIIDKDLVTAPTLGAGDVGARYIVGGLGGDWSGFIIGDIATWDGAVWSAVTPDLWSKTIEQDSGLLIIWNGLAWIEELRHDLIGGYDYSWGCVEGNGSWYPHPVSPPPPPPGREHRTPLRYGHNYSWQDSYEDGDPMAGYPQYTLSSIGRNINIGPTDVSSLAHRMISPPIPIYASESTSVSVFGNLDPLTLEPVFTNGKVFTWFGLPYRNTYYDPATAPGYLDPQWEQDQTGPIMSGWFTNLVNPSSRRFPLAPKIALTLNPSPIISYITPITGPIGTPISIYGAGFRTGSIILVDGVLVVGATYGDQYWVGDDCYGRIDITIPVGVNAGLVNIEIRDVDLQICLRHEIFTRT